MADDILVGRLFNYICGSGGFVKLSVLLKQSSPLGCRKSEEEAKVWLKNQRKFGLVKDRGGNITGVRVDFRKKLCQQYVSKGSCRKKESFCKHWHICKKFIEGKCSAHGNCGLSHNFHEGANRKMLDELCLEKYPNGSLKKIIAWSLPQVCQSYLKGQCNSHKCSYIHVCYKEIEGLHCDCSLSHTLFDDRHNLAVLNLYGIVPTNVAFVCCSVLYLGEVPYPVYQDNSSHKTSFLEGKTAISGTSAIGAEVQTLNRNTSIMIAAKGKPATKSDLSCEVTKVRSSCYPEEWEVFQTLCREYDGSASFKEIARQPDLFPNGISSAESWFRRTRGNFLIKESDTETGEISRIDVFSADARLCVSWIENQTCHEQHCQSFHVCKSYISDSCNIGASCPMNHSFHNGRDRALLFRLRLDFLNDEQLRKLVLLSSPQVCKDYNNSICMSSNSCGKIHICCGYLRNCCRGVWECGLEHESTFNSKQTRDILKRLQMSNMSSKNTLKLIVDDKHCLTGKDKTQCFIHVDNPDAPICQDFLIGSCKLGKRCLKHHCSLPYHWQYKVPDVNVWNSFGDKDNTTLERLYCDVNSARMAFKPVETLNFSSTESVVASLVKWYAITIDLDDMLIFLPVKCQGTIISQLRRLSTVGYVVNPCCYMPTFWSWYWEENVKVWCTYDKDCSARGLQHLIEQAYLDYLKEGKVREEFKFETAEHKYKLFFSSTGMYQVNLKTGTKRRVRRRPGKVISNEDMEDLKWRYGDPSYHEEVHRLLRAEKRYIPSHWCPMPPNVQYYRARVDPSSVEFKDLEKLFKRTMNDYVQIAEIERVQNLFMMEKYCRKKENMTATAARSQQTINERRLFHGTTPDAVEAICKHNFDWRLHGKNATAFGEGSYFARDASYSHTFAKEGAFGSRHMFVAKVLVGSYTKGHASYRRPPPKIPSDPGSDLYDSCVNNQSNPSVFVVFDTDQLYPEYIITYSTVSQFDSADSYHYTLLQGSTTAEREILKPPSSQTRASTKASKPVVPLQSAPSALKAKVLSGTSSTSNREIINRNSQSLPWTKTSWPVETLQSTPSTSKAQVLPGASSTPRRGILKPSSSQTQGSTKTSWPVVTQQSTPSASKAQVLSGGSLTPKRGILKPSSPQTLTSTKASGPVISLQSTPSGSQAQVLDRTSTVLKRETLKPSSPQTQASTKTGWPMVNVQPTQGNLYAIHAKPNPSTSRTSSGQSQNASYLAKQKANPVSTTNSSYSSNFLGPDVEVSVSQVGHVSAIRTAKERRQTSSFDSFSDHSTPTSISKYPTTSMVSSQEDPSLPESLSATGKSSNTTSKQSKSMNPHHSSCKSPILKKKRDEKCLIS